MGDAHRGIVIGVGNLDRGDDGLGREVARLLRPMAPEGLEVAEHDGEPTALIARLDGAGAAYLIDACASGAPAGTIHRADVSAAPLPPSLSGLSTHGLGLAEAIEIARALGQLPALCIVYAIEGESFSPGAPLSARVIAAASRLVRRLVPEISRGSKSTCRDVASAWRRRRRRVQ